LLVARFGENMDHYQDMINDIGGLGTYTPASGGEVYQVEDEYFSDEKVYENLAAWMEEVPQINYGDKMQAIDEILTNEMQNYLNGQDLDEVLQSAQQQAEALN